LKRIQEYQSDDIAVRFDPNICIHAAMCLRGAPQVFDVRRRPWISPENGTAEEIAAVVARCPSGALSFERLDGGPAEAPPDQASVTAVLNGPLLVKGVLSLVDAEGNVKQGFRFALCRCGQSKNKPHCDNSHLESGFRG
jgi:uncharacterized Fe-S cluster protein YjdI